MSIAARIAPHLPYLRRFSRAVTGSQTSGDAYVAAVLEALIADISIFPEASNDRISLYKLFVALFGSINVEVGEAVSPYAWEQKAADNLMHLAPLPRQAFLLVAVEGFNEDQVCEILDTSKQETESLLEQASREISSQVATDILIIEDEPLIAMDIEEMVESLGHKVTGIARTHAEAVRLFDETRPKMVLADIQLGYRCRQRHSQDRGNPGHFHHGLPGTSSHRRPPGTGLPGHQAVQSGNGQGIDQSGIVLRTRRREGRLTRRAGFLRNWA